MSLFRNSSKFLFNNHKIFSNNNFNFSIIGRNFSVSSSLRNSNSKNEFSTLHTETRDHVRWITMNRPAQLNAWSLEMFQELPRALKEAEVNEDVRLAVLTGSGRYFTSGADLSNTMTALKIAEGDLDRAIEHTCTITEKFCESFIDFPKPLIGVVNGPSIGGGTTLLALLDHVISSDTATFIAPFSQLGIVPELCSSYTFPRIMGQSLATEMLMFNRKLTAQEALKSGLISRVVKYDNLREEVDSYLADLIKNCYNHSMVHAKALMRDEEMRSIMRRHNRAECAALRKVFKSDEFMEAVERFMSRKNKNN